MKVQGRRLDNRVSPSTRIGRIPREKIVNAGPGQKLWPPKTGGTAPFVTESEGMGGASIPAEGGYA